MEETMTARKRKAYIHKKVKVDTESGCWEWQGSRDTSGYGIVKRRPGTLTRAHRESYVAHVGPIPEGMMVCHSCDNRRCVNPAHLWLGTAKCNFDDAVSKGRIPHMVGK